MNYIINPMWFYWVGVVDNLIPLCKVLGGILIVGSVVYCAIEEEIPFSAKNCIAFGIILLTVAIFIPSKETLIEMQAAEQATKENVELTIDTVKGMIDYIIAKVGELNN